MIDYGVRNEYMSKWRSCGVVVEGEPIAVGGINPWDYPWRQADQLPVELPHPNYPEQRHRMVVYEVETSGRRIVFAAGELSASVWAFYVPIDK